MCVSEVLEFIYLHLANREQGARREGLTGRTPSDEQHLGRMVHRITFLAVAIVHRAVLPVSWAQRMSADCLPFLCYEPGPGIRA
jgi:hypothetical protein